MKAANSAFKIVLEKWRNTEQGAGSELVKHVGSL